MLEQIYALKDGNNSVNEFSECVRQGIPSAIFGVPEPFRNLLVSILDKQVVYVVKDMLTAKKYQTQIQALTDKNVVFLPENDQLLIISKAFSKDTVYQRILALEKIRSADIIITTGQALTQKHPSLIESLKLNRDMQFDRDFAIRELARLGYRREQTVEAKGAFTVRGDVIDVYPINYDQPLRIDFFGDNIESIKMFDIDDRKNLGLIDSVNILQCSEYLMSKADKSLIVRAIKNEIASAPLSAKERLSEISEQILSAIDNDDSDALTSISALLESSVNIFELINKDAVIIFDEAKRVNELLELIESEFRDRFITLEKNGEVFSFMKNDFISIEEIKRKIKEFTLCALQSLSTVIPFFSPLKLIDCSVSNCPDYHLDFKEIYNDISNWLYTGYSVLICAGSQERASKLSFDLLTKGIPSALSSESLKGVIVSSENLPKGFIYHQQKIAVIGTSNLYVKSGEKVKIKQKKQAFFTAPEVGDYCVHQTHGIGRVLGSRKISTSEGTKDYISVEYFGGDVLHIPVEQMDILTRYLGGDKNPKLSKIGGKDFERLKKAVKESIKKMSFDLKKLYNERNASKGFKFERYSELQQDFDDKFEFDETPDQMNAEQDILEDMASDKVMDRLICGDVGFGKTEVAFRAIFNAIANGKQVAMLAPTTILTEQHFGTAVKRFDGFGIRIAALNRFKTAKEQKGILEKLKKGEIDLVIGTHRLLSKDVGFHDLGLLVLDEEQRFGVEHKERIKLLKKNVDTLTLTATPIPRTLHMSLSGIREISTINTPPKKRLPVQTYVTEQTDMLIRDSVLREINRGGQVFILYNRVETIFKFSEYVNGLIPDLKTVVVHGQMDEREMERNILKFYRGESDVLISTTIIENGIDLPKANTIIVIDADYLGLSTLYQLKGRVGRSDRLAYAYFTFKREKILSETAYQRLNAITDFTEMGSGIKIAMRDLEIRGAGNVLGAEQHGHMDKIGYELYSKMLREELSEKEEIIPELDIRVSAYIPDNYIESTVSRMDAYKEIAEINNAKSEQEFIDYCLDVYGKLPIETTNLINIALVKAYAMKISASKVTVNNEEVSITLNDFKSLSKGELIFAIQSDKEHITLSMESQPKIKFNYPVKENSAKLWALRQFLSGVVKE